MKKIVSLLLAFALCVGAVFALASCGSKKPTIGVIQFGSHESLNNCYTGVLQGLKEGGIDLSQYDVSYLNSNFSAETSKAQADRLVNSKASVIIAIATPSAIQAATAALGKNVPVVYCAVTDASQVANFADMTGTSDIPDFQAQLRLVTSFFGKSDLKIGVLMSTEESSDPLQLSSLQSAAAAYPGMQIIGETVSDITLIDSHVNKLLNREVDCLVNLLDNTIVGKLANILTLTDRAGVPVFGSEIEQVKAGCLASASIDYITVGKLCGAQAARVLKGESVRDVEKKTMENETYPYYNSDVLSKFAGKVTLPTDIEGLTDTKTLKS